MWIQAVSCLKPKLRNSWPITMVYDIGSFCVSIFTHYLSKPSGYKGSLACLLSKRRLASLPNQGRGYEEWWPFAANRKQGFGPSLEAPYVLDSSWTVTKLWSVMSDNSDYPLKIPKKMNKSASITVTYKSFKMATYLYFIITHDDIIFQSWLSTSIARIKVVRSCQSKTTG